MLWHDLEIEAASEPEGGRLKRFRKGTAVLSS